MPDPSPDQMLRGAGLQVTGQRIAVLSAVRARPHASADEVAAGVRAALGAISTQAVYDALGAMTGAGLIRRIQRAGSAARYETRVGDNHHHAICRDCGAVRDVDCAVGDAPCLEASNDHGFQIDEAELIYWGRCPDCHENTGPAGTSPGKGRQDHRPRPRSTEEDE